MHLALFPAERLGLCSDIHMPSVYGSIVRRHHAKAIRCCDGTSRNVVLNMLVRVETLSGGSPEKSTCPEHAVHVRHLCQARVMRVQCDAPI